MHGPLYGIDDMAASMRAVRQNTILMAGDIPDEKFAFRATPGTRSIGETLVHIAWLGSADILIHDELHLDSLEGFDFPALIRRPPPRRSVNATGRRSSSCSGPKATGGCAGWSVCPTRSCRSAWVCPAADR